MSSSTFAFIFSLLNFTFILRTTGASDPVAYSCLSPNNFTTSSPYEVNLNKLMALLYLRAPSVGYYQTSVGQHPARTYGLGLCRGDVSSSDCSSCVSEARPEIRKLCPQNKGGIIWYDHCMLKYMDRDFVGQIDDGPKFLLWNVNNVSDPISFNRRNGELLGLLSEEASTSARRYASGEIEIDGSMKIYGLAQCTRDLSSYECKKCLDDEISRFSSCCEGKQGGQVLGGSCSVRYEIYPFVKP